VDHLLQDLRYALRVLMQRPVFTMVAVLTIGLGIGANSAIFSIVNGVLFRPLPYQEPDRLIRIWRQHPEFGSRMTASSGQDISGWRDESTVLSGLAVFAPQQFNVAFEGGAPPEQINAASVSANLLEVLGVRPMMGSAFTADQEKAGANNVAHISFKLWQSRFAGSADVIGKTVSVNDRPVTITGVMPVGFQFPNNQDIWMPRDFSPLQPSATGGFRVEFAMGNTIARLREGVTLDQARREIAELSKRMDEENQRPQSRPVVVMTLLDSMVGNVRTTLLAFFGAVGLVLLIACANVANLLLARAESREREIAVRAAMGAGRARLIRQLLTESWLLAAAGGALGLLLAWGGIQLFLGYNPGNIPRVEEIGLDAGALLFTGLLVLLTGAIFGLAPALRAARVDLTNALKTGTTSAAGGLGSFRRNRFRSLLVVAEVAFSLVLLAGAGLLIHSFIRLATVDPGYQPKNVVAASMRPAQMGMADASTNFSFRDILERVKQMEGVEAAALASTTPLGGAFMRTSFLLEGTSPADFEQRPESSVVEVSPDYFRTMGIALKKGRVFTEAELAQGDVVMVNEAFVRKYSSDRDAIGRRILLGPRLLEIVGVVGDVKEMGLDRDAQPAMYRGTTDGVVSMGNARFVRPMSLVVRAKANPQQVMTLLRSVLEEESARVRAVSMTLLEERLWESIATPRFHTLIFGVMAGVALVLAAVGIYGVLSYSVTQRTREIGVRIALGADRGDVLRMVLGQGLKLAASGVVVGLVGAYAATRVIASLLFGIGATDVLTFAAVSAVLLGVALLACYLPARRATRVDPMVALRYE